jgi:hypothetical protein
MLQTFVSFFLIPVVSLSNTYFLESVAQYNPSNSQSSHRRTHSWYANTESVSFLPHLSPGLFAYPCASPVPCDNQHKISMWYVLTAFCSLQSDSRLSNWNVSFLVPCSHHFCEVEDFFFWWLTNCIWLYHTADLWHLEQKTFKAFWYNSLYQLVCVEDPPLYYIFIAPFTPLIHLSHHMCGIYSANHLLVWFQNIVLLVSLECM